MSVPISNIEESLSVSYVSAIVAKAGASFNIVSKDYGVDISVRRIDKYKGQLMDMGVVFDCQLKASVNWVLEDTTIAYDLEVDTYNKLIYRHQKSLTPCILVLLCLPKEQDNWLKVSEDELNIRKCCYYYYLKSGHFSQNKRTVRIRIPRNNIFTPTTVLQLMDKVRLGEIA